MAAPIPEKIIAQAIAAAISGWTFGTQVKTGTKRSPAEPGNKAVRCWVVPYAEDAMPYMPAREFGSLFDTRIQATVLGEANHEEAGLALARQVRDAIHARDIAGLVSAVLVPGIGGPNYLGVNENSQPMWSINWKVTYQWLAP